MDIQTGNPNLIYLVLLGGVTIALCVWSGVWRRKKLSRFALPAQMKQLLPSRSPAIGVFSAFLVATSVALLAIAMMDIRWGKTKRSVPQKGIEVVFALDVSRSMLAEDATPNRLERAKQQIKDIVEEMAGDRVALVVFAGDAKQSVPLTSHYDDFKQVLDTVGPHSVPRGGSSLGLAIEASSAAFMSKTNEHRTIVLFTDGEDQESKPVEIATKLHAENGTRIFTVGLGDLTQGARIPDSSTRRRDFVEHEGQQVWSKLNGQVLKQIATETDGAYIPAGTKRVDMADVYHGYIAKVEKTEFETAEIDTYTPRFQWFAGLSLMLLLLEAWLSSRKPNVKRASRANKNVNKGLAVAIFGMALFLSPVEIVAQEQSVVSQINAANELVRQNNPSKAIEVFQRIAAAGSQSERLQYNLAVAHYRNGDTDAAQAIFEQTSKSEDNSIAADSRYNLGNCFYSQALAIAEQDRVSAIDKLKQAIVFYRSSLRLDRSQVDARANIELAAKLIEEIEKLEAQEEEKQPPDQDQDKDEKENEEKEKDNKDESGKDESGKDESGKDESGKDEQDGGKSEEQKSKDDSKQDSESDSDQKKQDSATDQKESDSQDGKPSDESEQSNDQQESDTNKSPKKPDAAEQPTEDEAEDADSKAAPEGELKAANQQNEKSKSGQAQGGMRAATDKDGVLTRQEALKMLQAVRDRDMLRRLERQQNLRYRRIPVDKDW